MAHLVDIMVLDLSLRLWLLISDDDDVLMLLLWVVDALLLMMGIFEPSSVCLLG